MSHPFDNESGTVRRSPFLRRPPIPDRRIRRPAFVLTERDVEIVRQTFRHRFIQPRLLHALLGGSGQNIARRCRAMFDAGYLMRPSDQRELRAITHELIYGVTDRGAKLLAMHRELRAAELDWYENNRRISYATMLHHLETNEFLITLALATASFGHTLSWHGHHTVPTVRVTGDDGRSAATIPDAFFWLDHDRRGQVPHFLEIDRGHVMLSRMRERYEKYFRYWRSGISAAAGMPSFRVVTVTNSPGRMRSLQRVAATVGVDERHSAPWRGFLFVSQGDFALDRPQSILQRIFAFATPEAPISLLE